MADLLSQNIGTNYKSILNLDATTINTPLDATLRAVTDGMGTSSLLQLSTEAVGLSRTVNLSAGATNPRLFNEVYTINNSGAQTGTLTGLFLNATETALNGITHNLMDLQVGGVSKLSVNRLGDIIANSINVITTTQSIKINGATVIDYGSGLRINNQYGTQNVGIYYNSGTLGLQLNGSTGLLQFGGTTSSFPAIKRNNAEIQCVLADDSGRADFRCKAINTTSIVNSVDNIVNVNGLQYVSTVGTSLGNATLNACAILQADSTTRGFLPPRMTTTQKNAIASPAAGLVVYDTTLNKLAVFTTAWETVTSV
jgi:hypothetical protein